MHIIKVPWYSPDIYPGLERIFCGMIFFILVELVQSRLMAMNPERTMLSVWLLTNSLGIILLLKPFEFLEHCNCNSSRDFGVCKVDIRPVPSCFESCPLFVEEHTSVGPY